MSFKRLRIFIGLTIGLVSLAAGGPGSVAFGQRVKSNLAVGTIAPLSGPMSLFGKDMVNGMSLALDVIKQNDSDLGNRINIVAKDNAGKSEATAAIAKELVLARQADVFVGSVSSTVTETLIAEAERLEKSIIVPTATDQGLTKRSGVFRTCLNNSSMGFLMSQFAVTTLKQRTAIVLYDSESQYSTTVGKAFVTDFSRRGGKILESLSYRRGDGNFRSQLATIKAKNPGIIVVPGFYEEVGRIMKQAVELGIRIPMVGADGWDSQNLIRIAGKRAIRGHYFIAHFSSEDPDPKVQAFVNAYRRRFNGIPTLTSAMSYDGMLILADAFGRAQTNLASPLKRALENTRKVDGLMGSIYMTQDNSVIKPAVVLATTGTGWRFHSRIIPDSTFGNQGG